MKKFASLLLAGAMSMSLVACGEKPAEKETPADNETDAPAEVASDMKVAMITDYGDITDESFNQFTYEACKKFAEANLNEGDFNYFKPDGDSTESRVAMIEKAADDGFNVMVLPGFAFGEAIAETYQEYPDVKFVALDVSEYDLRVALDNMDGDLELDNVYSAVYAEELPGYMAGYAAVKMGYDKIGYIGGMAVPSVIRFGHGYVQGAAHAAEELGKTVDIDYAYGNQFFGDADITAAMDTWVEGGDQVIFAAGGGIYTSACEALVKKDGKVIGVDVDQSAIIDKKFGEGVTITSAMKGLEQTVDTLLSAIKDGKWDEFSGKIQTLGIVSANPAENYVGLPDSTQWTETFTEDDYKELIGKMHSGEIVVDNSIELQNEDGENIEGEILNAYSDAVNVNWQGNIK